MSELNAQPDLTRVDDLWFPDGNLILRGENTLFRVLSSILGARSSVFRDMVVPQPSQPDGDTVDGHTVVRLHDSATEVEVFLRAIFDSSFFMPPPSPVDFTAVIGVMRLAHKYDVQYLFRRALSHLDSIYPTDFSKFIDVNSDETTHDVLFTERTITLRAVSEVDALWILPAAYYFMSSSLSYDREGATNLTSHERQICLAALTEFSRATASTHRFLRKMPSSSCNSGECRGLISEAYDTLEMWSDGKVDVEPLSEWAFYHVGGSLCSACHEFGQEKFTEAQKSFWDRLPELFGLPDWNELIDMRRKVMEGPV